MVKSWMELAFASISPSQSARTLPPLVNTWEDQINQHGGREGVVVTVVVEVEAVIVAVVSVEVDTEEVGTATDAHGQDQDRDLLTTETVIEVQQHKSEQYLKLVWHICHIKCKVVMSSVTL